jgi:hypothetical protein
MSHIIALMAIYVAGTNKTRLDLHSVCPIILSDLSTFGVAQQIVVKVPSIKFFRESTRRSGTGSWGQADMTHIKAILFVFARA